MAHDTTKTGIRILLDQAIVDDATIGLYAVTAANSELRYADATLAGVAEAWATGFIISESISPIRESADCRQGGCVATVDGFDFSIRNTNQLSLRLQELALNLSGCYVEMIEFIGTEADSDATSRVVMFSGEIESYEWKETECVIRCVKPALKRRAELGTKSSDGEKDIPVTFGSFTTQKAVMVRDSKTETIYYNYGQDPNFGVTPHCNPINMNIFPVITLTGTSPYKTITIQLELGWTIDTYPPWTGTIAATTLYVKGIFGANSGRIFKVVSCTKVWTEPSIGNYSRQLEIEIQDYPQTAFENSGTNQSWVQVLSISNTYKLDNWPCKNFLNSSDVAIAGVEKPDLFTYGEKNTVDVTTLGIKTVGKDAKTYIEIPAAFSATDANKNSVSLSAANFDGTPGSMQYFSYVKMTDSYQESATTLSGWAIGADVEGLYAYLRDAVSETLPAGFYIKGEWDRSLPFGHVVTGANANAYDQDISTSVLLEMYAMRKIGHECRLANCQVFKTPKIPNTYNFEGAYLLIKIKTLVTPDAGIVTHKLMVRQKRFIGGVTEILSRATGDIVANAAASYCDNIPLFYDVNAEANNMNFFYSNPIAGGWVLCSGYESFPITAANADEFNAIDEIGIIHQLVGDNTEYYNNKTYIYDVAIAFKQKANIEDKVFTGFQGRIFGDTWARGADSVHGTNDLLADPIDQLESIDRLQNGSEFGDSVDWGKAYSPTMKINTASFDNVKLGDRTTVESVLNSKKPREMRPSWQIDNIKDTGTDNLKQLLCQTFGLISRVNSAGEECVDYIYSTEAAAESITILDIIPKSISKVIEPNPQDVYCNPVIKYGWDAGSETYLHELKITNADKTYLASYCTGFANSTDAELAFSYCQSAWQATKKIEEMPSDLSELKLVSTYNDALWVLVKRLQWMLKKRIGFSVAYSKGRAWYPGYFIGLTLPHQTNASAVRCMVENIEKDKNGNRCNVNFVILDAIPTDFNITYLQDDYEATTAKQEDDYEATTKKQDQY